MQDTKMKESIFHIRIHIQQNLIKGYKWGKIEIKIN